MSKKVRVGLIGSGFISAIHAESLGRCADAELFAVASPSAGKARAFAKKHGVPHHFRDYRQLLEVDEIDLVVLGIPNDLHCKAALDAAAAGKHIVLEKPMCLNLAEADRMLEAGRRARIKLMYAEELCFAPKYVRLKQLLDSGALGKPVLLKQSEKHDGPHAAHFWDVNRSGGGVTMDMGCHAIEFFRWILGRPPVSSVYAQMGTHVHRRKTRGEDNAVLVLEFASGAVAIAEESWTKLGGMDDRAEVHGSKGVAYADLLHGNAIETYSASGYDYAVEKAGSTVGWSFTIYEEIWNYGFVHEMAHFVDCVKNDKQPHVTGEDARAVLEVLFAAYESAGTGRKVTLPFETKAAKPFDLWRRP
ncbi:MAG TPA: Gfo/Idh/MocA family oxidoreductase [Candidatus Acidoferrum sp.]|jgi:myo-inositol 2-dehydrogenase/D-chiro-inositol 1-dehydrogenase|nr:Gfo/Idh/MocA family oxidoreductase [Candidatus Acidoferrum sp.]